MLSLANRRRQPFQHNRAVAAFMLDATEQRSHVHEIVGLAKA
jgi:hypothetical protein